MRTPFIQKRVALGVAVLLALGMFSASSYAQVRDPGQNALHLDIYEKVAFDANVLFGSNQSALSPAGRDALDSFVGSIHGLESRTVIAIGHADRMGSEAANQMLSEERVNAVKSYLVGKGVAADRVQTSAWGDTRPAISAGACDDANTAKNVACLQPDRRVTVKISGSRLAR